MGYDEYLYWAEEAFEMMEEREKEADKAASRARSKH